MFIGGELAGESIKRAGVEIVEKFSTAAAKAVPVIGGVATGISLGLTFECIEVCSSK